MELLDKLGPFFAVVVIALILYVVIFLVFLFKYLKTKDKMNLGVILVMVFLPILPSVYFLTPADESEGVVPHLITVLGPFALTTFSLYPIAGAVFITKYFKTQNDNFLWVGLGLLFVLPLVFISFFADKILFISLVTLFSLLAPFVGGIALLAKHFEGGSKIYLIIGLLLVSLPLISSTNILNSLNEFVASWDDAPVKSEPPSQNNAIPPHPMQPPMSN